MYVEIPLIELLVWGWWLGVRYVPLSNNPFQFRGSDSESKAPGPKPLINHISWIEHLGRKKTRSNRQLSGSSRLSSIVGVLVIVPCRCMGPTYTIMLGTPPPKLTGPWNSHHLKIYFLLGGFSYVILVFVGEILYSQSFPHFQGAN